MQQNDKQSMLIKGTRKRKSAMGNLLGTGEKKVKTTSILEKELTSWGKQFTSVRGNAAAGPTLKAPRSSNKPVTTISADSTPIWNDYELLAEQKNIDYNVAQIIIKLLSEGCTIPFIARYRKDGTNNMSPEKLREIKDCYENICTLKTKISTVVKNVQTLGQLNTHIHQSIVSARTTEELEHIYAPFKPKAKRTLAERAKELGLEVPALELLNNECKVDLNRYVSYSKKELATVADVEKGIVHIIASIIASDTEMMTFLRDLRKSGTVNFMLETKKSSSKQEPPATGKPVDEFKFEQYFDYKIPVKYLKPHQILAINRGESLKVLSVKIEVPEFVFRQFSGFCSNKWLNKGAFGETRKRLLLEATKDSYSRLVQPLLIREIRAELKTKAEKASYEVFSTNLKHLLLAPPLKGKPILAIDPGYAHGCKLALVSPTGLLLAHNVIYPHRPNKAQTASSVLSNMLQKHDCSLIALGNGKACRETEEWLSSLIKANTFYPLNVTYTIVNEDGASIYSCSPEAKKEFSELDPNIISAVSLARRIQDPLAELVKVEPHHLGVGMYQHDLKKKQLEDALNEVVSECVSFVGVDLNTASQCLLRRIAGLSDNRASQIIEHREQNGPFISRRQLTEVRGIGPRIFEQCAGFLRVGPASAREASKFYRQTNTTKLDCTYIHPESYDIALKLIRKLQLDPCDIGEPHFIKTVMLKHKTIEIPASNSESFKMILNTLCKPLNYDLRSECSQESLFKKGLTSMSNLQQGTVLTGRVKNVTHFGCFIDIGVECDGLIHSSKLNGLALQIGNRVEVVVRNVDIDKKRIGLEAVKKL